ncbi:MAG TPA: hypothetical protein VH120_09510, partial [Gemmataceae bacterium]|nr:hypothetical protein [Gemmataceae bacterium]
RDLSQTPRTVGDQPAYASKEPKYCLLVFGPKADTRVWLVLDLVYDALREKPGKADALYADLNGDGNLTGTGKRIPATVVTRKRWVEFFSEFPNSESEQHLPRFTVGDVKSRDGTTVFKNLVVDVGWFIFGRKDREVSVAVDVPGYGRQQVGGEQLWFADGPVKAPIIWFGGALTLRLAPSGMLLLPVDYSGKEPAPPRYEEFPLVRGKTMPLRVEVGSPGVGLGTFVTVSNDKPPADVHPVAKVVFPHSDPKRPPIEVAVDLNKRCCGTLFNGSFAVPAEAALGKASVTLSFSGWRKGNVVPAVVEVEVSDTDVRPKLFRD